jgi:hypothetical protein
MDLRLASLVVVFVSACVPPAPAASEWCADNPRAVAMAAGDAFWESVAAADVGSEELTEWAMEETVTAGEHAAVVAVFDRWRTDEPAAYERACTEAFNPG